MFKFIFEPLCEAEMEVRMRDVIIVGSGSSKEFLGVGVNYKNAKVKYQPSHAWKSNEIKFLRKAKKAWFRFGLPYEQIWYNKKLNGFKTYIVICTTSINKGFFIWLRQNNPECRIICYFTDVIKKGDFREALLDVLVSNNCEIWSYYQEEALKYTQYNMRYNPTCYAESNFEAALKERKEPEYDIFFIGTDKGRLDTILRLQKETENQNLSWLLYVTPTHGSDTSKWKEYKKNHICYKDAMKLQIKAKAVLEIIPEGPKAYTLRVWESLYLDQKLITNNTAVKELDFYDSNNIYVLGGGGGMSIKEFLDLPYNPVPEEIKKKYSFEAWLNRFFEQ